MYKIQFDSWDSIDVLVINGEGTLHNNRPSATGILDLAQRAQQHNIPVILINTVWQNMDQHWRTVTDKLYYWSVRDRLSQEYAQEKFGRKPDFYLDLSVANIPSKTHTTPISVAVGNTFDGKVYTRFDSVRHSIFDHNWDDFVGILRNTDMYVTGRFHEIMGACAAQTPFIGIHGNSWKVQGLIYSSGIPIPTYDTFDYTYAQTTTFFKHYSSHFKDFYSWFNSQTVLDINTIIDTV
jgi:polysaccharide pyruvyl transferase WcaK-like protein